jgi:hypothetical protein
MNMIRSVLMLFVVLAVQLQCAAGSKPSVNISGRSLHLFVNQEITLQGKAADGKSGALILGEDFSVYLAGMDSWPDGMFRMNQPLKKVEVTGILVEAYDLPAFVEEPDAPARAGIPVRGQAELKKASHRYLLKKARWKILP